jgi:prolyl-tRNA synthetase
MKTKVSPYSGETPAAIEELDTPNTPTIDSLVDVMNERFGGGYKASDTLKNVLLMADGEAISVLVPGDREVDLKRVAANLPGVVDLRLFDDEDFAKRKELVKGYVGPQDAKRFGLKLYADRRIVVGSHWITGANKLNRHARNVTHGRDFQVDGFIEAAEVRAGDECPECLHPVIIDRAIEIGHIFQLGRKYSQALDLTVLDHEGKSQVVTMGSYGIGVSRAVAAVAEQTHDELGLSWPIEIAPAKVHIVATGKDEAPFTEAEKVALALESSGITVLFDDRRDASPGVKFKDAELIGNPIILIFGKSLADGKVELRIRKGNEKREVPLQSVITEVISLLS